MILRMIETSLLHQMKTRLSDAKGRWPTIAREADVGYVWLFKVMQGRIKDPGVARVERVIAALDRLGLQPRPQPTEHREVVA